MAQLDLISLQLSVHRGAGRGDVGEPALLALPNGAPRQVSQGSDGEARPGAFAVAVAGKKRAGDLGSRCLRGGSIGSRGVGGGDSATFFRA